MDNFEVLRKKLEAFIKRYYLNELLRGMILFLAIGLLYFLIILSLEYFLWLSSTGRQVLFWLFVGVEVFLFGRFIIFPLLKLFRISKGIDYSEASRIIGSHFPEVSDKLLNLLQLRSSGERSELLLAGVDQKASELKPVPFSLAVDFRSNLPFLKYAAIPAVLILLIFFSGKSALFADSYKRVVHYNQVYAPPAPFAFQIINKNLTTRANEAFKLRVQTVGNVLPEKPAVHYNGQTYFLNNISPGLFEYEFEPLENPVEFYLSGNKVSSENYTISVVEVPELRNFKMHLEYPAHTGLKNAILEGSGNATIPEGTTVEWKLATIATDEVSFYAMDTLEKFRKDADRFSLKKEVFEDFSYQISTSNAAVMNYEQLDYKLEITKDEFPELELEQKIDLLENDTQYFFGKVSDDYGISEVRLIYYSLDNPEEKEIIPIDVQKAPYSEFLHVFPGDLELQEGKSFEFYFQVFDNDGVHNRKSIKSRNFQFRNKTEDEKQEERLEVQSDAIDGLNRSLENLQFSEELLEEISRLQKQKQNLDYNDRKKLENFFDRQEKQQNMMKEYSEKLKKNLEEDSGADDLKEQLEKRIEQKEDRLEENEKLLEELRKYGEKINEEELGKKLEEMSKNNRNQEKSLEQLLELTKKYYVQEKGAKISRDLEKLGEEQEKLADDEENNSIEAQESLSEKYEEIKEDLQKLEEENKKLTKPMETGRDKELEKEIGEEQEKAGEELQEDEKSRAGKHQKKAGESMKQLSQKMQQQQQMTAGEQIAEDAEMLRKILDNLVIFSFEQEDLLNAFKRLGQDNPAFASNLRQQNLLKEHFKHVDDSLYALALRNPMITENITEKLTDVEFALEKSLERLADNQIPQGMASQQYAITGANDLAVFLSKILESMSNMMNSSGGGGGDMQLPDIIKKQEQLSEKMQEGLHKSKEGNGEKEGQNKGQGSEQENGELFRIFQEQQMLRQQLEDILKKNGMNESGEELQMEMEHIEEEMLRNGFNEETLRRMKNLEHKLLELEHANLEQGSKQERESNTNRDEFKNTVKDQMLKAKEYFNTTEILNRQSLPLRQIYKRKVKEYFERGDH